MPESYENMKRRIVKMLAFAALWAVLLLACRYSGEGMSVHVSVAAALRGGTGWGRAMLAGAWQYPPLPTLAVLVLEYPARCLGIAASSLYLSFFQACVVWQLLALCGWRRCWCALLPLLLPRVFANMCVAEAGWLAAALFTGGLCAFVRWNESRSLREVMLGGIFFGLLALCGAFPALMGALGVLWFWYCARPGAGLRTLLWSVWAYSVLLILLWNWLVMGKPLYAFSCALAQISSVSLSAVMAKFNSMPSGAVPAMLFPIAPLCIYSSKSSQRNAARYMVICYAALLLYVPFCLAMSAPLAVGSAFFCTLTMAMCAMAGCAAFEKPVSRNAALAAVCLSLAYCLVPGTLPSGRTMPQAPERREITDFIDRLWPDSRTVLYGAELPALYPDELEKRFVAHIEYSQEELFKYASKEQMHLLLPPPESHLFPRDERLAEMYRNGAPWLFLEKKWDNGWKLWRIILFQES